MSKLEGLKEKLKQLQKEYKLETMIFLAGTGKSNMTFLHGKISDLADLHQDAAENSEDFKEILVYSLVNKMEELIETTELKRAKSSGKALRT